MRKLSKPPAGAKLKVTADMEEWQKEFSKLKTEDHLEKLASLGLDDEDLEEFKALEKGEVSLEDEFAPVENSKTKKAKKK